MPFDPDKPQPQDDISVSQADLLENFTELNTQFSVNHVGFDDTTGDAGKHKFVTFVQQADTPETKADEQVVYAKDSDGTPELFARPESNGTEYQLTKSGNINTGLIPMVAVNFNQTGAIQGTALNVASIARPGAAGTYVVTFTSALPSANYFWSVSGFDNSNNPVVGQVLNASDYTTVVKTTEISLSFLNQNGTSITGLTRACLICWRVQ